MKPADFEQFGLSSKEARVYLALLEIGNSTASAVAQKTDIPKSTVHDTLNGLAGKGFVSHYQKKNRKYFAPADPTSLLSAHLERQQSVFESILPELQLFYGAKKDKPRVRFYESKQGIEVATQEFSEETKEMMFISTWVSTYEAYPEYFPKAAEARVKHGVWARALVVQERGVEQLRAKDKEMLRESRLLPADVSFNADMWLWKSKAVFYDTKGTSVVIMEHEHIVGLLTQLFELLWNNAEGK